LFKIWKIYSRYLSSYQFYIVPLKTLDVIPDRFRREEFVFTLFVNLKDLLSVNSKLLKRLITRKKESEVVEMIGDVFVSIINEFFPYIEYSYGQVFAKHLLDEERRNNVAFQKFLRALEKLTQLRRLPLDSFLALPTTHFGRYKLLLKTIKDKTAEDSPDRANIDQALLSISDILDRMNSQVGKASNKLRLTVLNKELLEDPYREELNLNDDGRMVVREGQMTMRKATGAEILDVMLLDNFLVLCKKRENGYKMIKRVFLLNAAHPIRIAYF
jgi:hypothetical protein